MDRPTGRFYCFDCFEPTNDVIMSLDKSHLDDLLWNPTQLRMDFVVDILDVDAEMIQIVELDEDFFNEESEDT